VATINIGNLTFTHKGNYDGSTAYVKNDVVFYATNGNAYIAKQNTTGNAPTNGTYWSQFAAGSGGIWNAGLSLGSAGQVVKVNSGASALEFGTLSSDYVKLATVNASSSSSLAIDGHFTSDYQRYEIHASDVIPSNNCDFFYRVYSGGSEVGSNVYNSTSAYWYTDTTPTVQTAGNNAGSQDTDAPSDYFKMAGDDHYGGQPCIFKIVIHDPLNTNRRKMVELMTAFSGNGGSGGVMMHKHGHGVVKSNSALSGFAFYPTSGSITSGTFKLYGIK
jgi:phage baseplate assembly protein gpV